MPTKSNRDLLEDEENTSAITTIITESLTRQLFMSSVFSRFVTIITAITSGNIPQLATATESNKFGSSGDDNDSTLTTSNKPRASVLSMTLRSLPVSGCWAATITVSQTLDSDDGDLSDDDFYTYLAVVDTGSPFLTAPMGAFPKTRNIVTTKSTKKKYKQHLSITNKSENDVSYEQYGSTVGSVQWRMAPYLTLVGNGNVENIRSTLGYPIHNSNSIDGHRRPVALDDSIILETEIAPIIIQDQTNFVLGIPSEEVIAETGGIFLGLMTVDVARPTPLQQLGYDAFSMRFRDNDTESPDDKSGRKRKKKKEMTNSNSQATLNLWNGRQSGAKDKKKSIVTASLIDRFDPYSMKLFDLTPYGPNLHHYGVLCDRFECRWGGNEVFDAVSFDCNMDNSVNSCISSQASLPGISLSRPLVAVFDTGLSGCIFSDTLWEEIQLERRRLKEYGNSRRHRRQDSIRSMEVFVDTNDQNKSSNRSNGAGLSASNLEEMPPIDCTVWLPTIGSIETTSNVEKSSQPFSSPPSVVKLSSISNYWRFQSFQLPWWYDNNDIAKDDGRKNYANDATSTVRNGKHPHVVVLGSTFWRNPNVLEMAVDTTSKRAKITTIAHRQD